jgi:hypothetical protein
MTRTGAIVSWLAAGHLLVGGLYWLLLQVPESNAWMLASSLLIVLAAVAIAGVVEETAILASASNEPMGLALKTALRRAWLVVLPLAVFGCVWWLTGTAQDWLTRHAGQIDAWIIAKAGWTKTAGLHTSLAWVTAFIRYGIGTSLAVALLASLAKQGLRGATSSWLRGGLAWTRLVIIAAVLFVGVWLPWQAAYWRPASLPPTWVQPVFASVKLFVLYVVGNLAWAVVLRTASRQS